MIAEKTEQDPKSISIKVVEDTVIRRIDRQVYNKDNPNIKNRLSDLKVVDGSALMIELKDPLEIEEQDDVTKLKNISSSEERYDIDDTENIRTVIVNLESEKSNFERYQINIDWTLQQLTDYILAEKKLEPPFKIRNLTTNRLFVREELDTKLRSYPDFQIGGARVQLEYGRYPSMSEMVILVSMKGDSKFYEPFYVSTNATVKELKEMVCKEFGGIDPTKHTLFRLNAMDEPTFPLRRDNVEINKCHVVSGDELVLQSNLDTKPEDKLQVNIHLTMSGQPEDSQYIDKIELSQQYTLRDLKDVVLCMKQFEFAQAFVSYR